MAAETESGDEARAWAGVLEAWEDEAVHRAFLDRFADLDGLARAGERYRDVLAARPGDAVARRWRDEVVRRATAAGLASLPRDAPRLPRVPRWVRPVLLSVLGVVLLLLAWQLFRTVAGWERP